MIRTKYFVITIVACIAVILGTGVLAMVRTNDTSSSKTEEVLFFTPQNEHVVVPFTERDTQGDRKEFISKVRSALIQEPPPTAEQVSPTETETVPAQEDLSTDMNIKDSDVTTTSSSTPSVEGEQSPQLAP